MLCILFETIVNQASPDYVIYVVGEKFYFFGKQLRNRNLHKFAISNSNFEEINSFRHASS